jgi:LmbE family N-acetylglucosaminyl deacetylase
MTRPQASETDWLPHLTDLPLMEMPASPLLIVTPHPNDETLGAGGLIAAARAQGKDVTVAAVTDGENAYPDAAREAQRMAMTRRLEQEAALGRLGVSTDKIFRFGLPDNGLKPRLGGLEEWLAPLVSQKIHVFAPWPGDFHPDHEACGRAASRLAHRCGAGITFYFFLTWHLGTPELLKGLNLRSFPLTPDLMRTKREGLLCFRSQLVREDGPPNLSDDMLDSVRRPFEVFAV